MDIIESEFLDLSISRGKMRMFEPQDAILLIERCRELGRKILGIDAFLLQGEKIQPFMEHSIDYSSDTTEKGYWDDAKAFIEKQADTGFVFEIVYEGY